MHDVWPTLSLNVPSGQTFFSPSSQKWPLGHCVSLCRVVGVPPELKKPDRTVDGVADSRGQKTVFGDAKPAPHSVVSDCVEPAGQKYPSAQAPVQAALATPATPKRPAGQGTSARDPAVTPLAVTDWAATLGEGDVEGAGQKLLSNFGIVDEAKACGWTGFLTVQAAMEGEAANGGEPPRYRWHLGCILLKMPAICC